VAVVCRPIEGENKGPPLNFEKWNPHGYTYRYRRLPMLVQKLDRFQPLPHVLGLPRVRFGIPAAKIHPRIHREPAEDHISSRDLRHRAIAKQATEIPAWQCLRSRPCIAFNLTGPL